jgi:hypothetical protein
MGREKRIEKGRRGSWRTCSGGATPHRRRGPHAWCRGARGRPSGGKKMDSRVTGRRPTPVSDRAKMTVSHRMASNGRNRPGQTRPRWVRAFPAQTQVAAWARGSCGVRLGHGELCQFGRLAPLLGCWRTRTARECELGHGPCLSGWAIENGARTTRDGARAAQRWPCQK